MSVDIGNSWAEVKHKLTGDKTSLGTVDEEDRHSYFRDKSFRKDENLRPFPANRTPYNEWNSGLLDVYSLWETGIHDVRYFGDPWEIASAEDMLSRKRIEFLWMKGRGDGGIDMDFRAIDSKNDTAYRISLIVSERGRISENWHSCSEEAEKTPGPCRYVIAAKLFIEREFPDIISGSVYRDDAGPFWVMERYDEDIMRVFNGIGSNKKKYTEAANHFSLPELQMRSDFIGYVHINGKH